MSFGTPAPDELQPTEFVFTTENLERAQTIIGRYPPGKQQSAMIPLLDLAQRQHDNWLPRVAMDYVADLLEVPRIRAYEVASFYTMFNKAPVGKHFLQVCTTTPCWLSGSGDVLRAIKDRAGATPGHNSPDGEFTCVEVECLGACVNAPMMQVNDDYFEDLDYDRTCALIDALKAGKAPPAGSLTGRHGAEAQAGSTSLLAMREALLAARAAEAAAPAEPAAAPQPVAGAPSEDAPTKPKAAQARSGGTKATARKTDGTTRTRKTAKPAAADEGASKAPAGDDQSPAGDQSPADDQSKE